MALEKAPGSDDFSIRLFTHFWDVVKENMMNLMEEVHRSETRLNRINYTSIVLTPEKTYSGNDWRLSTNITSQMQYENSIQISR